MTNPRISSGESSFSLFSEALLSSLIFSLSPSLSQCLFSPPCFPSSPLQGLFSLLLSFSSSLLQRLLSSFLSLFSSLLSSLFSSLPSFSFVLCLLSNRTMNSFTDGTWRNTIRSLVAVSSFWNKYQSHYFLLFTLSPSLSSYTIQIRRMWRKTLLLKQ